MSVELTQLRERVRRRISPDIAKAAGISLEQLKQFAQGGYEPAKPRLAALAQSLGFDVSAGRAKEGRV